MLSGRRLHAQQPRSVGIAFACAASLSVESLGKPSIRKSLFNCPREQKFVTKATRNDFNKERPVRASRSSIRQLIIALLVSAASAATVSASPIVYGITFDNEVITVDPHTGNTAFVGFTDQSMSALGLGNFGGFLYAYDQTADVVRKLDPATGHTVASINVGTGNLLGEGDFTLRSNGTGFLSAIGPGGDSIYSVDVVAGTSHLVTSGMNTLLDGLAFSPSGVLYAYGESTKDLYTVNQTTGALTLIGSTGLPPGIPTLFGMTFLPDGTLLLAGGLGNSGVASLYTVDTVTGAATLVGNTGFDKISGLTTFDAQAVPEPASSFLAASGLVALYARRRRRLARDAKAQMVQLD